MKVTDLGEEDTAAGFDPVEMEIVSVFMRLGQVLGAPKSLGAIYGLLFVSFEPIAFDEIVRRLRLSAGSVSQGLKTLKVLGAVRTIFLAGDRRDHFIAETRLRHLVAGFARETVEAHLRQGAERLDELERLMDSRTATVSPGGQLLFDRVATLRNWHRQAQAVLPTLLHVIEPTLKVPSAE